MDGTNDHTEERIAGLLRLLPPAPAGWVEAAQELPGALVGIDVLVARATADAAYRAHVLQGLEQALLDAGLEASPAVVEALRHRLQR
jgi:hypothetical protein